MKVRESDGGEVNLQAWQQEVVQCTQHKSAGRGRSKTQGTYITKSDTRVQQEMMSEEAGEVERQKQ